MAEETPAETPVEESVAPASATPEPESSPEYVSKSDLEAFGTQIVDQIVPRITKSQRDSIQARVSTEVNERMSELDKAVEVLRPLMREDVSEEDVALVKERQFIRDLMAGSSSESEVESDSPPQEEVPEPASSPPGLQDEIQSILDAVGVSGKEPELMEYAEKNKGKPWYQTGQGFEELAKSIAARSAGTPAGVVAPQGQVANPDLVQEYRTELDGLLYHRDGGGKITGDKRRNMNQLRQLQEKYSELGLKAEDMELGSTSKAPQSIHDWAPPV